MGTSRIRRGGLNRIEGEGALHISIRKGSVRDVQLDVFESHLLIESFLRGRNYSEVPELTAGLCGIYPAAYQMGAVCAIENAFGIEIPKSLRDLRRILHCGEWIESHATSIYLLHAPDFLGYSNAIEMAGEQMRAFRLGMKLKKAGRDIVSLLKGREKDPLNICVGGFRKVPCKQELSALGEQLKRVRDSAVKTVRWVTGFAFPQFERSYEFVALSHPEKYAISEGHIVSNTGLHTDAASFESHVSARASGHWDTISFSAGPCFVGPLARYNLNFDKLSDMARDAAESAGIRPPCQNPFLSIVVRAVEILNACEEAIRLIETYEVPEPGALDYAIRPGVGCACTESPRGILYHRYGIDSSGSIREARIISPTSQNRKSIEGDLRHFMLNQPDLSREMLKNLCVRTIRNYDPSIYCPDSASDLTA